MENTGRLVRTPDIEDLVKGWTIPACAAVTVDTSQVLLATGEVTMANRRMLIVFNNSSSVIYVGPTGVTTSSGIPVLPNDYWPWPSSADLYAIAAGAGNDVRVMEAT